VIDSAAARFTRCGPIGTLGGMALDVLVETVRGRAFASAAAWPGWCRSGRDQEAALAALVGYTERFAAVVALAGLRLPTGRAALTPRVVEQLEGNATTSFGAPGQVAEHDRRPTSRAEAGRQAALVGAAWEAFDEVIARAPAELRKGPRGGGRDRDKIVAHVVSAEVAYARKIGLRLREAPAADTAAVTTNRRAVLEVLARPADGSILVEPSGWPPRYAARRIAWHVLDHAWEVQDRSGPSP
jgi:hypothetical protein